MADTRIELVPTTTYRPRCCVCGWRGIEYVWRADAEQSARLHVCEREGYLDVRPDVVLDDFSTSDSEPLTARAGWGWTEPFEAIFVKADAPITDAHLLRFDKEWMIAGRTYCVEVSDGAETWWEKVDGLWKKVLDD